MVEDDEIFGRWVFDPRYVNSDGTLNDLFISLRVGENGISGMLVNRAGHELVISTGHNFKRKGRGKRPDENLVGYAVAKVADIRAIKVEQESDSIDVIEVPSDSVPHHAIIKFTLNAVHYMGNTPHPRFRAYTLRLKRLFTASELRS